ncbi:MAG: glycosyltransferase family 4 protein [Ignavibacteriales bacterium]|nr:MAG: glycosyltransferase family 4 protein [Ignavibacteriales bacterium]
MKPLRVLHTIRQGSVGGGETYLYNLVKSLDRSRFEPVVLSFTEGEMVDRLRSQGITTHVIYTEKPFAVHLYTKVKKLIIDEKIDFVHIHGTRAATNTLIPARMAGVPAIYTVHGWSFHTGNNKLVTWSRILSEKFITRFADQTVCGSEADLTEGRKHCPAGRYNLIHNSIDSNSFNPEVVTSSFREENGYSSGDFIVSFIARMTFQKDPQTFIRAIPLVLKSVPDAKFLMVGDGELKEEAMALAVELKIEQNIRFLPFSKNVKEVLKAVDVFVLPSLWEVIPLALLEAMAMKKLCIGTDIPGTTEALKDGVNGFLFKTGNEKELAEKMLAAYAVRDSRELLTSSARKTVTEHFDLKQLVRKNQALYAKLLSQA